MRKVGVCESLQLGFCGEQKKLPAYSPSSFPPAGPDALVGVIPGDSPHSVR
jgi:hypothetical protein